MKLNDDFPDSAQETDFNTAPVRERFGRIEEMDRSFDYAFWQEQTPEDRLRAGWQLIEEYLRYKGRTDELRLQRTVATFCRR